VTTTRPDSRLRVAIVDDEPLAREGLAAAVARLGASVDVVAQYANGLDALDGIRRDCPEILFLDISMPVLDGFAMLEQLEPEATPPAVVFVTAYDEHAVRAFETEATDFLVKPVSDDRLRTAVERASRRIAEKRAHRGELDRTEDTPVESAAYLRYVVIPERGKRVVVPIEEVEWFEGDTYYVRVHANGRVRLLRDRLSRLESVLDPSRFRRAHRSAIVRVDLIRELRPESPYSYSALLATGERVPVSRERLRSLEETLRGIAQEPSRSS
jgi:two-component system, LytTR family, response regulator